VLYNNQNEVENLGMAMTH